MGGDRRCYLPLLDVLDAAPGRVTLSVTPVLGDQLEAPGARERCARSCARCARVAPARHRRGGRRGGGGARALGRRLRAAAAALAAATCLAAARGARDLDVGGDACRAPAARDRRRRAAAGRDRDRGAPRRFGGWGGGFWLPECAHAPWLDALLEEAGVHATCVDLTDVLGRGDPRSCAAALAGGPLLVPIDRAVLELVWSDGGYPSRGAYRDTPHG